jgi:hypothetical protein
MPAHVKNGTPLHGAPLCETCVYAHIARGFRESEELVLCARHEPVHRVPFRVRECSGYLDKTRDSLYEMKQIAWLLAPRGPKRAAGFMAPPGSDAGEPEVELILTEPQPD